MSKKIDEPTESCIKKAPVKRGRPRKNPLPKLKISGRKSGPYQINPKSLANLTRGGNHQVKGAPPKIGPQFKMDIIEAYHKLGGVDWLVEVARNDPKPFMALMAKCIPQEIKGELTTPGEGLQIKVNFLEPGKAEEVIIEGEKV